MRTISLLVLIACVSFGSVALGQDINSILSKELPSLEALYKDLHQNPELSYYEVKTSARIAEELRKAGFEVTTEFGTYENPALVSHGVVAVLKNGKGPTVLVRTDLDALPMPDKTGLPFASTAKGKNDSGEEVPVTHGCGHDMHMTVFVGTARALSALRSSWKGTLIMIGQPAEERAPGGAVAMLRAGLYSKYPRPDYCLALHNDAGLETGKFGWVKGYALAGADSPDITIKGAGGHGAYPYLTKDPVVMAAETIVDLQSIVSREIQPGKPAVITIGSLHAGTKRNIIPDDAHMELTVRSYEKEVRDRLLSSIERVAKGVAAAGGGEAVVDLHPEAYVPAVYNNPDLVEKTLPALRTALGADNVVERAPVMGTEDFAEFSLEDHSVPSVLFWLGSVDPAKMAESKATGKSLPSLHSSLFAPVMDSGITTGVKAMTAAVINLMK